MSSEQNPSVEKKTATWVTLVIFGFIAWSVWSCSGEADRHKAAQVAATQETAQPASRPEPPKADDRPVKVQIADYIRAIEDIDDRLSEADKAFKRDTGEALRHYSPEMLRQAYDDYDTAIYKIENVFWDVRIPDLMGDSDGAVAQDSADVADAINAGIQARHLIASNIQKMEPGNYNAALALAASEEENRRVIAEAAKNEKRFLARFKRDSVRLLHAD